jgi:hypothetical protein
MKPAIPVNDRRSRRFKLRRNPDQREASTAISVLVMSIFFRARGRQQFAR